MDSLVAYRDHPPVALEAEGIRRTVDDYVRAARMAMAAGFDGVEIHAGNGYLVDQFLNSNVNTRSDAYGGSVEKRCKFALDLIESIGEAVGVSNVAIRLSPFGVYNDMGDGSRFETWSCLLQQIQLRYPELSYVHFVEPREDDVNKIGDAWPRDRSMDLRFARDILQQVPIISAGGWNDETCWDVVDSGRAVDACAFARWFVSNPDLVDRLRLGTPLTMYNRKTFYGPSKRREIGYTDYPTSAQTS
jgi:2,4-dienoyl-CoA reductase-like NADH-dependent reductase (Old Yellow Enzyme family)